MKQITDPKDEFFKKYLRIAPHRFLNNPKTFIEIDGHDKIVMLTVEMNSIFDVVEQNGMPVKNPNNNLPFTRYTPKVKMEFISKDDYDILIKSRFTES